MLEVKRPVQQRQMAKKVPSQTSTQHKKPAQDEKGQQKADGKNFEKLEEKKVVGEKLAAGKSLSAGTPSAYPTRKRKELTESGDSSSTTPVMPKHKKVCFRFFSKYKLPGIFWKRLI